MINSIACGKVILFGEHAVVHGEPGIALPVQELSTIVSIEESNTLKYSSESYLDLVQKKSLRKLINFLSRKFKLQSLNIKIDSSIPIGCGLGSSASLSISLIRGINELNQLKLDDSKINDIALECEKLFHGSPSGIDNTVINYEKPIYFINGKHESIRLEKPMKILIVNSGISTSTKEAILQVKKEYESKKGILKEIGNIAKTGKKELEKGNLKEIGKLMVKNHELLTQLGVSTPEIDLIVKKALYAGAYGAKLSGKGFGGCVIILANEKIKLPYDFVTSVIE